jgi:hypothetical protein
LNSKEGASSTDFIAFIITLMIFQQGKNEFFKHQHKVLKAKKELFNQLFLAEN